MSKDNARQDTLPGNFVAGLVEGEGCFAVQYRRETKLNREGSPTYFRWWAVFVVALRRDDAPLLESLKSTLRCGSMSFSGGNARFQVQDILLLRDQIVPFFERFPLYGKKRQDFELWKEAVGLIASGRGVRLANRSPEELARLNQIRNEMLDYKSKRPDVFKWHRTTEK